jgi:hypothetical protein
MTKLEYMRDLYNRCLNFENRTQEERGNDNEYFSITAFELMPKLLELSEIMMEQSPDLEACKFLREEG